MASKTFSRILITGASSGLGAALALELARPGVTLFLSGRNGERLFKVADQCRGQGADVFPTVVDVTDAKAMADWTGYAGQSAPLDLVIANAGISGGTAGGQEGAAQVRAMLDTNVQGVMNTLLPAIPIMQRAGQGQLAIVSSLAGFRGFPGSPVYCGSKAAVKVYGEGLRGLLRADGIGVTVICPGYIETGMTAVNDFPMPLLMPADQAARLILKRLARNPARITFPAPLAALVWLLSVLPASWVDGLLARLPRKGPLSPAADVTN